MRFSNCYPHCGGEDCVCCEIFVDNQREAAYGSFSEQDEYEEADDYDN